MERPRSVAAVKTVTTALINIEDAIPGMVLAEPVRDATGRLLVTRGAALSRRLQRQLRLWGIAVVAVEVRDEPCPDFAQPARDDAAALDLIETFQSEPFMQELARLAQLRQEAQMPSGGDGEGGRS
jgi:hypothetical protein